MNDKFQDRIASSVELLVAATIVFLMYKIGTGWFNNNGITPWGKKEKVAE